VKKWGSKDQHELQVDYLISHEIVTDWLFFPQNSRSAITFSDHQISRNTFSKLPWRLSRAPRPTLHLLRMEDLEAAGFAAKAGTGPDIQQVLKANASRAAELGLDSGHRKISWESKGAVPQNLHQENMAL